MVVHKDTVNCDRTIDQLSQLNQWLNTAKLEIKKKTLIQGKMSRYYLAGHFLTAELVLVVSIGHH